MKNQRSVAPEIASPDSTEPLVQKKTLPQAENNYDYYKVPANIDLAKKHGRAKRVYCESTSHDNNDDMCDCCGFKEGEKIPLKSGLAELYHLGSGYPLYFRFIKYAIAMLGAIFVVSGLYNLISNVAEGDCTSQELADEDAYCVKGYILSFALPNKRDDKKLLKTQLALNFLAVIAIMIFFHLLRYKFRRMKIDADQKTVTPSDYTLELRNIPVDATNDDIEKWIREVVKDDIANDDLIVKEEEKFHIERIIRVYAIHSYIKLYKQQSALSVRKFQLNASDSASQEERNNVEKQLAEINDQMDKMKNSGKLEKCPIVFITFRRSQQAALVKSKFKQSTFFTFFSSKKTVVGQEVPTYQGQEVIVKRAPEPTDIMWKNLQYGDEQKTKIRWMTYGITALIIVVSFGIILLVNWAQGKAVSRFGEGSSVVQGLSIVASLVVFMTNSFLSLIIDHISKFEKHTTHTHYLRGVAEKLAIAQFLNTAFTNLFAEIILASGDADNASDRLDILNFYGKGGLLENMYWVFITNAFLSPILTVLDPTYLWKNVQRYWTERKGDQNSLTQMEANLLYEGVTFDMPKKYAGLIKIVLLTAFYAPAMPFALIFTIFGLTLWFWADKYMLLKHMSLPKSIDDDLTEAMVEYLEWAACTFAVGSIMYAYTLKDSTNEFAFQDTARSLIWLALAISLFHIFFPMSYLNKRLFKMKSSPCENQTFEEARLSFNSDYDIENPMTRKLAFRKHLERKNNSSPTNKNNYQSKDSGELDFDALDNYARRDQEQDIKGTSTQAPELKGVYKKLDQLINADQADLNNLFENIFGLDIDNILNEDTPKNTTDNNDNKDDLAKIFVQKPESAFLAGIFGGLGKAQSQEKSEEKKQDSGVKWSEILGGLHLTLGLSQKVEEKAKEGEPEQTPLNKSAETTENSTNLKLGLQESTASNN